MISTITGNVLLHDLDYYRERVSSTSLHPPFFAPPMPRLLFETLGPDAWPTLQA